MNSQIRDLQKGQEDQGGQATVPHSQDRLSMDEIIAIIRGMTVLELAELVKALEEEFGVSAAAQVLAAVPGTTEEVPKPTEEEKTEFDITLREIGPNKISIIKTLRELRNLGLKEAKELAETAPNAVLGHGIGQEEATILKLKLEQLGAKVEVK